MPIKITHVDNQFGFFNVTITHDDGFEHRMSFYNEWGLDDTEMLRFCEEQGLIVKDLWQSKGKWKPTEQGGSIAEAHQEARTQGTEVREDKEQGDHSPLGTGEEGSRVTG